MIYSYSCNQFSFRLFAKRKGTILYLKIQIEFGFSFFCVAPNYWEMIIMI